MKKTDALSAADRMEKAIRKLLRGCSFKSDSGELILTFPLESEIHELRRAADKYGKVKKVWKEHIIEGIKKVFARLSLSIFNPEKMNSKDKITFDDAETEIILTLLQEEK